MTDIEQFMNQHEHEPPDVTTPIKVEQGPAMTPLESALAELESDRPTHLTPRQAEALLIHITQLEDEINDMQEQLDFDDEW